MPGMKTCSSEFLQIRGRRLHVRIWGSEAAPLLVLLHGWCDVSASWQFVVDALERDWRIVAPDWRGFGLSEGNNDAYWFPDYIADLDALLLHYSPNDPVRLVGHSLGGNAGTRAAMIGGASFSSNTGMSATLGLPPKGTHAHSLVQLCMALGIGEEGAFEAYADTYPDDTTLLVDTIDTLESGVPNAIRVFEKLRRKGRRPVGIRLDSGDQAFLAIQAAKMLDEAGFEDTSIVLSSDLDELVIWQILTQIAQEAPRYGLDADKTVSYTHLTLPTNREV